MDDGGVHALQLGFIKAGGRPAKAGEVKARDDGLKTQARIDRIAGAKPRQ